MPSIASRIVMNPTGGQPPTAGPQNPLGPSGPGPTPVASPPLSTVLRCPLPVVGTSSTPDSLRQYYAASVIPQYRFNPPAPLSASNQGSTGASSSSPLSTTLTTAASISTTVSLSGITTGSKVSLTPTNSIAAAMTGVYVVASLNKITVFHPATLGGTFSIIVAS